MSSNFTYVFQEYNIGLTLTRVIIVILFKDIRKPTALLWNWKLSICFFLWLLMLGQLLDKYFGMGFMHYSTSCCRVMADWNNGCRVGFFNLVSVFLTTLIISTLVARTQEYGSSHKNYLVTDDSFLMTLFKVSPWWVLSQGMAQYLALLCSKNTFYFVKKNALSGDSIYLANKACCSEQYLWAKISVHRLFMHSIMYLVELSPG